jgi:two-component system, cell cycle sensor histidine kinase and response regulator CckA
LRAQIDTAASTRKGTKMRVAKPHSSTPLLLVAAQEKLRITEQLFRGLEDAQAIAHLGSWATTRPDEPIAWSAECARIFGRERAAAPTGDEFLQLVLTEDRAGVIAARERAFAGGDVCETEHRIVRPTGEIRRVFARTMCKAPLQGTSQTAASEPDHLDGGHPAFGVVQDITDRKRTEENLGTNESRYRRIVENTSEGVWIYDGAGNTTFMNSRMAEMLGCAVEDAVGHSIFAFMDKAAVQEGRERLARRKRGLAERGDFRLTRRDGTDLWVSLHTDPLMDPAGNFEGSLALVTDITDRRRADQTRNLLASIVASSDDAIISRGVDGIIHTWNRGAERLTLYSAEEAVGKSIGMLYPPEQATEMAINRARVDGGQSIDQVEMVIARRDGSRVDISLTSSVLRDEGGNICGVSSIARNISEKRKSDAALRRTEEQLRQAQKMEAIGSLAGGMAHDFNNILSVILSYTSMIADDLKPSDPLRADIDEVHKAGLRATALTRQLLVFSRQQMLQPIVLDLNQIVSGVSKMLGRLLGEDIELSFLTSALAGKVHADPGQIEQVIMNLVVNGRDAMPHGGNLTIETANITIDEMYAAHHAGVIPGDYVMMAVTDTGTGMDAATIERIFEPFFTTKDKSKGTGLGLSTVYGIIQQSGGHISVYSELGKGTTFKVYLPRTDRVAGIQPPPPADPISLRGTETILLVEDQEQVRTVMQSILRKQGYNVLEAQNGGEAFLLCEQFSARIHMLVTDVVMPRMSGRQLAERLAQLRPEMKVMYVSGYTDDTIVHHGVIDAGMAFLQKPIMPASLLAKVRQVLDSPSHRRSESPA